MVPQVPSASFASVCVPRLGLVWSDLVCSVSVGRVVYYGSRFCGSGRTSPRGRALASTLWFLLIISRCALRRVGARQLKDRTSASRRWASCRDTLVLPGCSLVAGPGTSGWKATRCFFALPFYSWMEGWLVQVVRSFGRACRLHGPVVCRDGPVMWMACSFGMLAWRFARLEVRSLGDSLPCRSPLSTDESLPLLFLMDRAVC